LQDKVAKTAEGQIVILKKDGTWRVMNNIDIHDNKVITDDGKLVLLGKNGKWFLANSIVSSPSQQQGTDKARDLAQAAYHQIEAHVFEEDELRDAQNKLTEAEKLDSKEPFIKLAASLAVLVEGYNIGDWYEEKTFEPGTISQALNLANSALELDSDVSQTYAHIARLYIVMREFSQAEAFIQKAKNLDRENFYPWYFEGILFVKEGHAERAKSSFNEAELKITQNYQSALLNRHRQELAELENNPIEQEKLLKDNIAMNPSDPILYGNYATFLKNQGRYNESVIQWENALQHGYYRHAEEQLIETKRLRDMKR
jgi:tetratricopeptide (TPR) repeat protein